MYWGDGMSNKEQFRVPWSLVLSCMLQIGASYLLRTIFWLDDRARELHWPSFIFGAAIITLIVWVSR